MAVAERSASPTSARTRTDLICGLLVGAGVVGYVGLFSARTISAYTSGASLFDLATYAQGFWNALGDPPFFYSLEGEMSRFGRHFSPFFYLLLPFYWLHPDPTTLLALQALAIGLGALPIYWLAKARLGSPTAAAFAFAYLLDPAVHDINVQNDFHEIAFALPTLLLAFYLGPRGRWWAYAIALLVALSTREEVALTGLVFGLYLATGRQRWRGLATLIACAAWFFAVTGLVMPAFNAGARFPMPEGFAYLGDSPLGVVRGIVEQPGLAIGEVLSRPKLAYVFWLLAPLAFLPLLAPETLLIAAPALLEVLVSTYAPHFRVFERYAAPIVPVVFLAAVLGAARARSRLPGRAASAVLVVALLVATSASQVVLRKLPTEIQFAPDAHAAVALRIAESVPRGASVAVSDHRLLPHLAQRRLLYPLSATTPAVDYVIFDHKREPITVATPAELQAAEGRFLSDPAYQTLRCEDGVFLLGRREAVARDGTAAIPADEALATFDRGIRLRRVDFDPSTARPGGALTVALTWQPTRRVGADYQVFVQVIDGDGRLRAQHDGAPQGRLCPTSTWTDGLTLRDEHVVPLPSDLAPGRYEIRVGLYDLATLRRLSVNGSASADYLVVPLEVRP